MFTFKLRGGANRDCTGTSRRDLLQIGALSALGLALPDLMRSRAAAASTGPPASSNQKSVVWVWLGGGPTHVETFDPKMSAPSEFRSTTGEVQTSLPGVTLGGTFPQLARRAHRMAVVRSFAHDNSGHSGGTHWVMTGKNHPPADNGAAQIWPSLGSMAARYHGPTTPTHVPNNVALGGIYASGAAWLGGSYNPFAQSGEAARNMVLQISEERLRERRALHQSFDTLRRDIDRTGLMGVQDQNTQTAFNVLTGQVTRVFDTNRQDPRLHDRYGRSRIGQQMLLAAQLATAGVRFIQLEYGGWDMHGQIQQAMTNISPPLDQALSAFIDHMHDTGLSEDVLLVVTGEFGRTPRINGGGGRDHWAPLSTLALAGGGLRMGQVVGDSNARVEVPRTRRITPSDLAATVLHVLGIPVGQHYNDQSGRPQNLVDGLPIPELI